MDYCIFCLASELEASVVKVDEVPWLSLLSKKSVNAFHVCGNSDIFANAKSIKQNFLVEPEKYGYLFSNMLSVSEFNALLRTSNGEVAKQEINKAFKASSLWKYSEKNGFESVGAPIRVELPFTSSIKDCVEGKSTNYGDHCSSENLKKRQNCCSEKFPSPILYWGEPDQYTLFYEPGSGIRLKVPDEKKHRFCNFFDLIQIK